MPTTSSTILNPLQQISDAFYSWCFPDPTNHKDPSGNRNVNCPFHDDSQSKMVIDSSGYYECKTCKAKGNYHSWIPEVEGIPVGSLGEVLKLTGGAAIDLNLPSISQVDQWSKELNKDEHLSVRQTLETKWGLDGNAMSAWKFGFDSTTNEVVIPYLSFTGQGVIGSRRIKFVPDALPTAGLRESLSCYYSFGAVVDKRKKMEPIYLTLDEIDTIVLREKGFVSTAFVGDEKEWDESKELKVKGRDVVLVIDSKRDSSAIIDAIINDLIDKAASLRKIDLQVLGEGRSKHLAEYLSTVSNKAFEIRVTETRISTQESLRTSQLIKEAREQQIKRIHINPAQDFVDDKMWYGVEINDQFALIDSTGKLTSQNDLKSSDTLKLSGNESDVSKFSLEGIQTFFDLGAGGVSAQQVYEKLVEYIRTYVFFKDPELYGTLALWTIGTYVFRVFHSYPYIHINAAKGSAKTLLMEVLEAVAFNGRLLVSPRGAALFRDTARNSSTTFIDEAEKFRTKDKESFGLLQEVLNSGYKRSGRVSRTVGKVVENFSCYSPKVIAGIEDIYETLSDRCIRVQLIKKRPTEVTLPYKKSKKLDDTQKDLRDNLYLFGMKYASVLSERSEIAETVIPQLKGLTNRRYELWLPLFTIANIIDESRKDGQPTIVEALKEFEAKEKIFHDLNEYEENEQAKTVTILRYMIKELRPDKTDESIFKYRTSNALEFFKSKGGLPKGGTSTQLTRMLSKLGVQINVENLYGKSERMYSLTKEEVKELTERILGEEESLPDSTQTIDSMHDKQFIPKRLIVTPDAMEYPLTERIIERVKKLNPQIDMINSLDGNPDLPATIVTEEQKHQYLRETIVLAKRSDEFFETFPSPGDIVEKMNTMCRITYQCPSDCEYCYLQYAGGGSTTRWRRLFVDVDRIENELKIEKFVHRINLTLWSALSFYLGKPLEKVYPGFTKEAGKNRKKLLSKDNAVDTDVKAKDFLKQKLADHFVQLKIPIDSDKYNAVINNLHNYYNENTKKPLWINIGEYSDIVALEHIGGYVNHFMDLIEKDKELRVCFYTKSANINNLLTRAGDNRVMVVMNLNTPRVINKYERHTASLANRIEAVQKLLETKQFKVYLTVEPIIRYDGSEEDYISLVRKIKDEIELQNNNLVTIKFGGVRYRNELATQITSNHPNTDLFSKIGELVDPEGTDERLRYNPEYREEIYRKLMCEIPEIKEKFMLGCEFSKLWKKLNMDWQGYLEKHVFQYSERTKNIYPLK